MLPIVRDWLLGRPRNFKRDAGAATAVLQNGIRVHGLENVPAEQPLVVTMNHYRRPGFGLWWMIVAIADALPQDPHLIMTSELTRWFRPWGGAISRAALPRLARMYGFTAMPPMPPRPTDVEARAEAVRGVLKYVKKNRNPIVMLAPEGRDNVEDGSLASPPRGVGRFVLLLADRGLAVLPVGGWEAESALHVRFGRPYRLNPPRNHDPGQTDLAATETVMSIIADLLPERLRGDYAAADGGQEGRLEHRGPG
jgi:1-acyl-sn-glycerol-3-phosphate acyltransferase